MRTTSWTAVCRGAIVASGVPAEGIPPTAGTTVDDAGDATSSSASTDPGAEADVRGANGEVVWSVRGFGFSDYGGGRFIATASPAQNVLVSSDAGASWWEPSDMPEACLAAVGSSGGIASGDGTIVGVGAEGTACRSEDGGDTWALQTFPGSDVREHLLWTGREFVTWAPGAVYRSPDGAV